MCEPTCHGSARALAGAEERLFARIANAVVTAGLRSTVSWWLDGKRASRGDAKSGLWLARIALESTDFDPARLTQSSTGGSVRRERLHTRQVLQGVGRRGHGAHAGHVHSVSASRTR